MSQMTWVLSGKIAPVTADFWATINVSVNIKGETLTSVCEKQTERLHFVVRLLSELSDETELVTVELQQLNCLLNM